MVSVRSHAAPDSGFLLCLDWPLHWVTTAAVKPAKSPRFGRTPLPSGRYACVAREVRTPGQIGTSPVVVCPARTAQACHPGVGDLAGRI